VLESEAAAVAHDAHSVLPAVAAFVLLVGAMQSKVMGGTKHQAGPVQLWERLRLWLDLVQQVTGSME
jgi:uncharacterized protein YhhL (DUF1145 family)